MTEMDDLLIALLEIGKAILVPSTALTLTMAAGVFMLWSSLQKTARWVVTIPGIAFVFIAVTPVSHWIAYPLEKRISSRWRVA